MRIAAVALAGVVASACGGGAAQPPHGPAYTPVHSPEARTRCPAEWKAAKRAREDLLGQEGATFAAASEAAARALLAQARCETRVFAATKVAASSQASMAAALRAQRGQYLVARNLYEEAARTAGGGHLRVGAYAQLAELHMRFATLIDELPTPVDVHDPVERTNFHQDLRQLMSSFEVEAALAAERALEAAGGTTTAAAMTADPELAGWIRSSCATIAVLDPDELPRLPSCRGTGALP